MTCIFCDILEGKAPANFVYRDEFVAAFMDIHPVNPGHVLIIPTTHAVMFGDVDRDVVGHMLQVAQQVGNAIRSSGLKCEAINLFMADGRAAGQEVMHCHLHVFPRYSGDGHHLRFSPAYFTLPSAAALEQDAEKIRSAMGGKP